MGAGAGHRAGVIHGIQKTAAASGVPGGCCLISGLYCFSPRTFIQARSVVGSRGPESAAASGGNRQTECRKSQGVPLAARLCEFPGLNVPCGVQGAEACRRQWRKQAGGALEIARSDACVATMRVSRTRAPERVWDRSRARPVGEKARRSVWKRKGALARRFRSPGRQPKNPGENVVSEQAAKQPTIETGFVCGV